MTPYEHLCKLHEEYQKIKFPEYSKRRIEKYRYKPDSANGLTRCIVSFINYSGGQAEPIKTTGTYIKGKIVKDVIGLQRELPGHWRPNSTRNGSADISSTIPVMIGGYEVGLSVKWEVKWNKDTQSDDQKEYEKEIRDAKGYYFIVKTLDDFYDKYFKFINSFK